MLLARHSNQSRRFEIVRRALQISQQPHLLEAASKEAVLKLSSGINRVLEREVFRATILHENPFGVNTAAVVAKRSSENM